MRARAQWAVFAQVALTSGVTTAVRPMLTYRGIDLGASSTEIGLLATTYALLPVLFAFSLGRQIDQRGPVGFLIAGSLISVLGTGLAIVGPHLALLYAATAGLGIGQQFSVLAQQAAVAAVPADQRDRAFGRFSAAAGIGLMAGPPIATYSAELAGLLRLSEAVTGLLAGLVLSVLCLALAWSTRRERTPPSAQATEQRTHRLAWQILRTPGMWQAMLAGGTVLAAVDMLAAFLPLWAEERGISIGLVGALLTIRGLFTLLSRIGSNRLLHTLGRRTLLLVSLAAAAAGLFILTFVGVPGAVVVMLVLGLGLGLAQPLTMSWIATVSAPETRGAALGMRVTANRLAQAALPATVAAIAGAAGADGVFWIASLVMLGSFAALVRAPMQRAGPPEAAPEPASGKDVTA